MPGLTAEAQIRFSLLQGCRAFRDLAFDHGPVERHRVWEYPNGTFAYDDMNGLETRALKHIAAVVGNRELCQESAVKPEEVSSSYSLGFGRWLNKEGRPELITLTFLSTDSHALRARRVLREERPYVRRIHFVRLNSDTRAWDEKGPDGMLPAAHRHAMSEFKRTK